jgi:protein-tyrosine phosphatase
MYDLAVDLVERCARGEVIYLHCWGSPGRTGSVV